MEYEFIGILIVIPLCALLFAIVQSIFSRIHRRKLTELLENLYHGRLSAVQDFHFLDTSADKLYFPFTEGELRRIGRCREFKRHDLTVELMYPGQAFWDNYYFHIVCDLEGVDDQYQPFALKKEGYLYIACSTHRGMLLPCITHVERRATPFIR